jgi:hypothetical protein
MLTFWNILENRRIFAHKFDQWNTMNRCHFFRSCCQSNISTPPNNNRCNSVNKWLYKLCRLSCHNTRYHNMQMCLEYQKVTQKTEMMLVCLGCTQGVSTHRGRPMNRSRSCDRCGTSYNALFSIDHRQPHPVFPLF